MATLVANGVKKLLYEYNSKAIGDSNLESIPLLDYGIGINLGPVRKFKYKTQYPQSELVTVGLQGHAITKQAEFRKALKTTHFMLFVQKMYTIRRFLYTASKSILEKKSKS